MVVHYFGTYTQIAHRFQVFNDVISLSFCMLHLHYSGNWENNDSSNVKNNLIKLQSVCSLKGQGFSDA